MTSRKPRRCSHYPGLNHGGGRGARYSSSGEDGRTVLLRDLHMGGLAPLSAEHILLGNYYYCIHILHGECNYHYINVIYLHVSISSMYIFQQTNPLKKTPSAGVETRQVQIFMLPSVVVNICLPIYVQLI